MLAVTKRWHLWRHLAAKWLLVRVVVPSWKYLEQAAKSSAATATEQHGKAALRMEVCKRCPAFSQKLKTCDECGCFMPAKVQKDSATCPQGRW